jgi:hypothetical protein
MVEKPVIAPNKQQQQQKNWQSKQKAKLKSPRADDKNTENYL